MAKTARGRGVRKYRTPAALWQDWEAYKKYCDTATVTRAVYNARNDSWNISEVPACHSYDITGFCAWAGLAKSAFYDHYRSNPDYADVTNLMVTECEADVRRKLETGCIPSSMAGLLLGRYGYASKQEVAANVSSRDEAAERVKALIDEVKSDEQPQ